MPSLSKYNPEGDNAGNNKARPEHHCPTFTFIHIYPKQFTVQAFEG